MEGKGGVAVCGEERECKTVELALSSHLGEELTQKRVQATLALEAVCIAKAVDVSRKGGEKGSARGHLM